MTLSFGELFYKNICRQLSFHFCMNDQFAVDDKLQCSVGNNSESLAETAAKCRFKRDKFYLRFLWISELVMTQNRLKVVFIVLSIIHKISFCFTIFFPFLNFLEYFGSHLFAFPAPQWPRLAVLVSLSIEFSTERGDF